MTNEQRMSAIIARGERMRRNAEPQVTLEQATRTCWSCRHRERFYEPVNFANCENSFVDRGLRCWRVRDDNGLCGPDGMLYRRPAWYQPLRWVRWLMGDRP